MQANQFKFNIENLIYLLILSIPLCAISGNLLLNLNLILTSLLGTFLIVKNKNFFFLKENFDLIILFLFFLTFFLITFFFHSTSLKLFSTIKFLFFSTTLVYFFKYNERDLNKIFFFYSIVCLVLIIDVIFQSYFLKNILGNAKNNIFNSSLYGDEKLAGFHIQFFSFFTIFYLSDLFKKKFLNDITLLLILIAIPLSIYVSLNRISIFSYFLGIILYFFLIDNRKKIITLISIPIFILIAQSHPDVKIKERYLSFFHHSSMIYDKFEKNFNYLKSAESNKKNNELQSEIDTNKRYYGSGHANLFSVAFYIWQENKFKGIGYKNFFKKCSELKNLVCSSHPHNIYLDILLTSGIFSFLLFCSIILMLFTKSLKVVFAKYHNQKLSYCLFISGFTFFFPLKSTGSLYASYYGTFIFLLLALIIFHFNKMLKKK